MIESLYVIGSLRNRTEVVEIANTLEGHGIEVFDDWLAPGEQTDEKWREWEQARGRTYLEALDGWHPRHVFEFDKHHLDRCDGALLICPAGKSAHIELGYTIGCGKPGLILLDDPERWDIMYLFATGIYTDIDALVRDITDPSYMKRVHDGKT